LMRVIRGRITFAWRHTQAQGACACLGGLGDTGTPAREPSRFAAAAAFATLRHMAFHSFGDFLKRLEAAGELRRFALPVATELEITEFADREMKSPGGGKALLFEKPTINGEPSPFPLAINTLGSHRRMAMSLGADSVEAIAAELGSLIKARPPTTFQDALHLLGTALHLRHARPKPVGDGPCKEVIHKFEPQATHTGPWPAARSLTQAHTSANPHRETGAGAPTLLNLPIQKCWPCDGGRFLTLPCVVSKDPDTGERNVGLYRMQVYDALTCGMHWQLQKVGARHGRRYYETGTRMPVAVFLGGDPVFTFCATAPLPDGLDEFLLAGYLRRKSVALVKCETNDLEVPAEADFVLEGYVDPKEPLREEGPFGDHTGYYTLPEPYLTPSFISPPLRIGKTRCIPPPLLACRPWKIFKSAAPR